MFLVAQLMMLFTKFSSYSQVASCAGQKKPQDGGQGNPSADGRS
jgi:hypothetical protein